MKKKNSMNIEHPTLNVQRRNVAALEVAMDTLRKIAVLPRNRRARQLASATAAFLETQLASNRTAGVAAIGDRGKSDTPQNPLSPTAATTTEHDYAKAIRRIIRIKRINLKMCTKYRESKRYAFANWTRCKTIHLDWCQQTRRQWEKLEGMLTGFQFNMGMFTCLVVAIDSSINSTSNEKSITLEVVYNGPITIVSE